MKKKKKKKTKVAFFYFLIRNFVPLSSLIYNWSNMSPSSLVNTS